jgi:hypothetical protein
MELAAVHKRSRGLTKDRLEADTLVADGGGRSFLFGRAAHVGQRLHILVAKTLDIVIIK